MAAYFPSALKAAASVSPWNFHSRRSNNVELVSEIFSNSAYAKSSLPAAIAAAVGECTIRTFPFVLVEIARSGIFLNGDFVL